VVQPDAVVVELCASRVQVLSMNEEYLNEVSNESKIVRLKKCINQVLHDGGINDIGNFLIRCSSTQQFKSCQLY